jgi:hypothetical protein
MGVPKTHSVASLSFHKHNATARDRLECLTEIQDKPIFFSKLVVFEFVVKMWVMIVCLQDVGQRTKMRDCPTQSGTCGHPTFNSTGLVFCCFRYTQHQSWAFGQAAPSLVSGPISYPVDLTPVSVIHGQSHVVGQRLPCSHAVQLPLPRVKDKLAG